MLHTGCGPFDIPAGMVVSHGTGDGYDGPPDAPKRLRFHLGDVLLFIEKQRESNPR